MNLEQSFEEIKVKKVVSPQLTDYLSIFPKVLSVALQPIQTEEDLDLAIRYLLETEEVEGLGINQKRQSLNSTLSNSRILSPKFNSLKSKLVEGQDDYI